MLIDAHNHLQDSRLDVHRDELLNQLNNINISAAIVNGTSEQDWALVQALAKLYPWVIPSYGIHPWEAHGRSIDWQNNLLNYLENQPNTLIGEIGLDKWIKDYNLEDQISVFETQLELAIDLNRPVTIHCLRAFGTLREILKSYSPLPIPFLLHSYSGPVEMVDSFTEMGAYFSLSGYFANPDKIQKLEVFKKVPQERLLIETDAPAMLPPENLQTNPLQSSQGMVVNSPANITSIYQWAATFCETEYELFASTIQRNFLRFIGRDLL